MRIIFTPLAERQLDKLHTYVSAAANESRADGYVGRIIAFCQGLTRSLCADIDQFRGRRL